MQEIIEYIDTLQPEPKKKLLELRKIILKLAPSAQEKMSYGVIGYYLNKPLVYIGGFKDHVSIFPGSAIVEQFKDKLTEYHTSKGTISFPIRNELPVKLIKEIVEACSK